MVLWISKRNVHSTLAILAAHIFGTLLLSSGQITPTSTTAPGPTDRFSLVHCS
jgi:hypothetical protein